MKLVRFGEPDRERPGLWIETDDGPAVVDVRAMAFDIADYDRRFFMQHGLERVAALASEPGGHTLPAANLRLGPPIAPGGAVICVGRNYAEHAREFGSDVPEQPQFFLKASSTVIGPNDPVILPPAPRTVDAEAELAVVIGRRARQVDEQEAMRFVAGYTVVNDITERQAQRGDGQWFRGKSCDTFCPLGPFLVTPDEVERPDQLAVRSRIDDQLLQDGNTRDMLFRIPFLVAYLSRTMTLYPGDILSTGTPAGIGSARQPQVLLQPGGTVEVEVEGLGRQCNPVREG